MGYRGLRLVVESEGGRDQIMLAADEAREPLAAVLEGKLEGRGGDYYLEVGRKLVRIDASS